MTRPSTPPILSELRSPSSPATQVAALKALKNEIIGHEQKKEMWIGLGVVAPIARILNTHRWSGKRRHRDVNGNIEHVDYDRLRTEDEEARLQAIIIVGSLAHGKPVLMIIDSPHSFHDVALKLTFSTPGGPAYIPPLNNGSIFPPLLSILCPSESHPQLVLAALRALNAIADSRLLERSNEDSGQDDFMRALYTDLHLSSLAQILDQYPLTLVAEQQISLAAALVTKTCREETHRKTLAHSGVLEALATRLASFIVATRSSKQVSLGSDASNTCSIAPATTRSRLAPILHAIGTIIIGSKLRRSQFAHASVFSDLFPKTDDDSSSRQPADSRSSLRGVPSQPSNKRLPPIWAMSYRESVGQATSYAPAVVGQKPRSNRGFSSALEITPTELFNGSEEDETPLVTWLIHVVRAESGVTRLMASWVVILLHRSGLTNRRRDQEFALLLVPLLVRMIENEYKMDNDTHPSYDNSLLERPDWTVKEQTPSILAMLVVDSLELQKAAVEAGAIKKLSQLLKQSYDPVSTNSSAFMWSPNPSNPENTTLRDGPSACRLGPSGLSPIAHHVLQMRESVLIALAALATAKDEYRKSIIENGVVPFVIESLKPHNMASADGVVEAGVPVGKTSVTGNPTKVLLAACGTSRALSRSVSTLRTSLIDAGLAAPLYTLLRHEDIEVQIAATAVICNLVLEFSPMREVRREALVSYLATLVDIFLRPSSRQESSRSSVNMHTPSMPNFD